MKFPTIATDDQGFVLRTTPFRSVQGDWGDVVCISSEKIDKITYEENFLVLGMADGRVLTVGELDHGFDVFQAGLPMHFPGFPSDWRESVESGPAGARMKLWPPKAATSS